MEYASDLHSRLNVGQIQQAKMSDQIIRMAEAAVTGAFSVFVALAEPSLTGC